MEKNKIMKKGLLILLCLPMIGIGQNVNIPDSNFKTYLVGNSAINTNGDTEIQVSEATVFNGTIDCNNMNISDLVGVEAFTALTRLICNTNQLTSLDVSTNTALTQLYCGSN
jgi:Leucine-rich repeat (LRR) protein